MNSPDDLYEMTFTEPEARILERIIREKASNNLCGAPVGSEHEEVRFSQELLNKLQMRSGRDG